MNKTDSKICILLSVYRPNELLHKQLDSIDNNKVPVLIFYRFDESCKFELDKDYKYINFLECKDSGVHLGAAESYWSLILNAPLANTYYLCDQDDVWSETKITTFESTFYEFRNTPTLIFSNFKINNSKQGTLKIQNRDYLTNSIFENPAKGCTQAFNRKLLEILRTREKPKTIFHDHWIYFISARYGNVFFLNQILLNYILHEGNAVGMIKVIERLRNPYLLIKSVFDFIDRSALLLCEDLRIRNNLLLIELNHKKCKIEILKLREDQLRQENTHDKLIKFLLFRFPFQNYFIHKLEYFSRRQLPWI